MFVAHQTSPKFVEALSSKQYSYLPKAQTSSGNIPIREAEIQDSIPPRHLSCAYQRCSSLSSPIDFGERTSRLYSGVYFLFHVFHFHSLSSSPCTGVRSRSLLRHYLLDSFSYRSGRWNLQDQSPSFVRVIWKPTPISKNSSVLGSRFSITHRRYRPWIATNHKLQIFLSSARGWARHRETSGNTSLHIRPCFQTLQSWPSSKMAATSFGARRQL